MACSQPLPACAGLGHGSSQPLLPPSSTGSIKLADLPSVAETATQLQLELAKVRIAPPMRPLSGCGHLRSASRLRNPPSRLASAFAELAVLEGSAALAGGYLGSGGSDGTPAGHGSAANDLLMDDDEEEGFATPLAATPTAYSPELPCASKLQHGNFFGAEERGSVQQLSGQPAQQQQQRHLEHAGKVGVPPLNLHLVRPYSSLSCESLSPQNPGLPRSALSSPQLLLAEASTSVSSLSSLGPPSSTLTGWPCSLPAATGSSSSSCIPGSRQQDSVLAALHGSPPMEPHFSNSWRSERLDASLARLAALTANLMRQG